MPTYGVFTSAKFTMKDTVKLEVKPTVGCTYLYLPWPHSVIQHKHRNGSEIITISINTNRVASKGLFICEHQITWQFNFK
jgi:hypothetical protein